MSERFLGGRKAWVTGGATGIGRAIALALAKSGADVAVGSLPSGANLPEAAYAARPSQSEIDAAADAVRTCGVKCFALGLDLRDEAAVDSFHAEATAALGAFDILINAAGVSAQEEMLGHRHETWAAVLDINLNGCYRTIKRTLPAMVERRWGRIVNIASTAAEVGFPGYSAYCASKAALLGLTRCVALEGAEHGVTCNAINPGSVGTDMMRLGSLRRIAQGGQGATVEENFARIAESMPQKRLVRVEEIAAMAVFLCRNEAFGITGEAITISGGATW
ncbi:MAG: SDR family oxidoreductase [Pseudomonadota bacterium]|nr:SDR family oxidoreductase [Pseudomonadota bacterium]